MQLATSGASSLRSSAPGSASSSGCNGLGAELLDRGLIHARGVVVADLLGDGVAVLGRRGLLQNAAQVFQIVLVQLAVNAPRVWSGGMGLFFCQPPQE